VSQAITILVATVSGTAELVAEEVAAVLEDAAYAPKIVLMDKVTSADLKPGVYLICSSTYGTGEVPDNGKPLYSALNAGKPDLTGVLYGVIGLGDSMYPNTFCFGGKQFDELFEVLGASRVGERLDHDRRSGIYPEDMAREWVTEWIRLLSKNGSEAQAS
jgi:MioC protein